MNKTESLAKLVVFVAFASGPLGCNSPQTRTASGGSGVTGGQGAADGPSTAPASGGAMASGGTGSGGLVGGGTPARCSPGAPLSSGGSNGGSGEAATGGGTTSPPDGGLTGSGGAASPLDASRDGTAAESGGSGGSGASAGGACAGLFCEDFESGKIDPAIWDVKTSGGQTLMVQKTLVAHGQYAAQFHAAPNILSYDLLITKNAPAGLRGHHFGRAYSR